MSIKKKETVQGKASSCQIAGEYRIQVDPLMDGLRVPVEAMEHELESNLSVRV